MIKLHIDEYLEKVAFKIARFNGIEIEIRPAEQGHNVPHIHVHYGGKVVPMALDGALPTRATLAPPQLKQVRDWLQTNRAFVLMEINSRKPGGFL